MVVSLKREATSMPGAGPGPLDDRGNRLDFERSSGSPWRVYAARRAGCCRRPCRARAAASGEVLKLFQGGQERFELGRFEHCLDAFFVLRNACLDLSQDALACRSEVQLLAATVHARTLANYQT